MPVAISLLFFYLSHDHQNYLQTFPNVSQGQTAPVKKYFPSSAVNPFLSCCECWLRTKVPFSWEMSSASGSYLSLQLCLPSKNCFRHWMNDERKEYKISVPLPPAGTTLRCSSCSRAPSRIRPRLVLGIHLSLTLPSVPSYFPCSLIRFSWEHYFSK